MALKLPLLYPKAPADIDIEIGALTTWGDHESPSSFCGSHVHDAEAYPAGKRKAAHGVFRLLSGHAIGEVIVHGYSLPWFALGWRAIWIPSSRSTVAARMVYTTGFMTEPVHLSLPLPLFPCGSGQDARSRVHVALPRRSPACWQVAAAAHAAA